MKKLQLLFLLFWIASLSFSQETRSYVGLTTGISFPVGKFASKTLDGGSFALPGWRVNLDGTWQFYKDFGIGLQVDYYSIPLDVRALGYERVLADAFLLDVTIRSDPYRFLATAAFFQYSLPVIQNLSFIPKAGGGIIYGFSPYQLHKAEYYLVGEKWFEITSTRDWGGYFTAGGSLNYQVNDCIGVVLKADYGYGTVRYRFLTGSGDIREDVHHFMVVDTQLGFRINF